MANITANNTAAFISYGGEWDDSSDETRNTSAPGSTMSLMFNGTTLSAFGIFNPSNDNFTYLVDGQPPAENINTTIQLSQSLDLPFLVFHNLTKGHHSMTLNLTNGTLGLSRLIWYDPHASAVEGPPIHPSNNSAAVYTTDGQWGWSNRLNTDFWTTSIDLANITFSFQGTGIMLMGLTDSEGGSFNATLDNFAPVIRNANSSSEHLAVLHRNDGLPNKNHTLTLTKTGGAALRVGQAHIFIAPPDPTSTTSTDSSPSSTETASASATPTSPPSSGGLSKGAVAGTVIGVLAGIGLLAVVLWFWLRRRLAATTTFEKNRVAYARVCSKCRQDIVGDYRLECANSDCPARIDLHPECKDWNVPEHHDHEVREVPNK